MSKADVLKKIFAQVKSRHQSRATSFAPTNIALIKYWGKRDQILNLPNTSSLSLTLPDFGTSTKISIIDANQDQIVFNDKKIEATDSRAKRLRDFLDLFRPYTQCHYQIETKNTIPTSAGLASSASGFAALVLALNQLHHWQFDKHILSILARLGSGSACRSFWRGFVIWTAGEQDDGSDSFAKPFASVWPELCLGFVLLNTAVKEVSSRQAMQHTVQTSLLYRQWPSQVEKDLKSMQAAINEKNFKLIGQIAEANAMAMHATMMAARPAIVYGTSKTWQLIEGIWQLRKKGLNIYFTQDAGPNIKLLFEKKDLATVRQCFPEIHVQQFS